MVKSTKAAPVAPPTGPVATPAPFAGYQGTLKVTPVKAPYRGARAAWYAVLLAHDGKSVQGFLQATQEKPPSLPKSGKAENPTGWLGWFVRHKVCTYSVAKS